MADKCKHWYQYTYEQHYTNVNPVFVTKSALVPVRKYLTPI